MQEWQEKNKPSNNMHVKIQGGGGVTYANTGSCSKVAKYLEHEDEKK